MISVLWYGNLHYNFDYEISKRLFDALSQKDRTEGLESNGERNQGYGLYL